MSPPGYVADPEHRDSLPEDVYLDVTRYTVRTFQRVAAAMLARQDMHGAEVRKFSRALAAEYLAECQRQAREASEAEFGHWLQRRGDLIRTRGKVRHAWAVSS